MFFTHPIYGKVKSTGRNGHGDFMQVQLVQHPGLPCGGGDLIYVSRKFLK